jgi:phospholipase C
VRGRARRPGRRAIAGGLALTLAASTLWSCTGHGPQGIHKIQHVIVIMQENRSFDEYFGTYPGADGIPTKGGQPTVCSPDPESGECVAPAHDPNDVNGGGPHSEAAAVADIAGGKMDGFVAQQRQGFAAHGGLGDKCVADPTNPLCSYSTTIDVMGWHDAREIPNYWEYARQFVLHDRMFEPAMSWSLVQHLYMVSEWSARCTVGDDPTSCVNEPDAPAQIRPNLDRYRAVLPEDAAGNTIPPASGPDYAWTDLTYLMHQQQVSWGYYVVPGGEPDCEDDDAVLCETVPQNEETPSPWNPLLYFDTVRDDGELGNIQAVDEFYRQARQGTLPSVSWVVPSATVSEHAPAKISDGQAYVTSVVNAAMQGPEWDSTAIFLSWDDWGGFYDHVVPPSVDENGWGIRVPSLLISPYAKRGYVDHQTLSFDAYGKFIEDVFLDSARLDPKTDRRPDPRPTVRENAKELGDLANDFDFHQSARPPVILPTRPPPGPASQ